MARNPSVRVKNGRWYSEAGGVGRYLGRVDAVSKTEATARLWAALAAAPQPKGEAATVGELRRRFIEWVGLHRSEKTRVERARHLDRFVEFCGSTPAESVDSSLTERFAASLFARGYAADYVVKHYASIKAMYRRGVKMGWIPPTDPFARVEPIPLPPKALLASDLPTPSEVEALIRAGDSFGNMGDLLRLYHATGARTYELLRAKVGDYEAGTRAIVLRQHKTSRTQKDPTPRVIHLSPTASAIVERLRQGRSAAEPLFVRPESTEPYSSVHAAMRFKNVRKRAKVRDSLTLYSFRHLWISEALMAGVDVLLVARMSGTSTKMIETVYGRFRTSSFVEAQDRLDALRGTRH